MLFQDITYINDSFQVVEHAFIGTEGDRITYIGTQMPEDAARYGRAYCGKDKLLLPGFYNAHSHIPMGLLRGYGENLSLHDWLHTRIFPFEARMRPEDIYWATLAGALEMLRYGIVSTTDMYSMGDAMTDAFLESGLKANLSLGTTCFDDRTYRDMPQYRDSLRLAEAFNGKHNGQITIELSLHAEYTTHEALVRTMAEVAKEHALRMHVHVSETAEEVAGCKERHNGLSPVAYLAACGLFDTPTTAAHCVHLSDADIALLKQYDVTVASCPKSNLKLASGVCPAGRLLQAGVRVALGTDSVASNNNLNMTEEMRFFALLHKGMTGDPTLITPAQALAAATLHGAQAQGRTDCGSVAVGNRADLVVMDTHKAHMQPVHNLLNNLVYSADGADIILTMVDGEVRYEDGCWPHMDAETIWQKTEAARTRILQELAARQ